jgi:hypothetical protein
MLFANAHMIRVYWLTDLYTRGSLYLTILSIVACHSHRAVAGNKKSRSTMCRFTRRVKQDFRYVQHLQVRRHQVIVITFQPTHGKAGLLLVRPLGYHPQLNCQFN